MRAMILAAGLGTRLKPFTDFHPKALAMVNGKSLLQRNIEYLQAFGINEVVVNVHHFADQIMEAVETNKGWEVPCIFLMKAVKYWKREGVYFLQNLFLKKKKIGW
jgi:NDP-sugar pyrophosphorylase family protein